MLNREQLSAIVRLLVGIGIFMLMLAFMRACFSPPQLPPPKPGNSDTLNHGTLPPGY
jgi:hypothetical protein